MTGALSGDVVCVDIDDANALAMADQYLPETGLIEGRSGKPRSHRYYRVVNIPNVLTPPVSSVSGQLLGGPRTVQFRHADQHMLLEVLGTGRHAVAPPSLHPSGEPREWDTFEEPAVVDCLELYQAAERLAVACGARPHLDALLGKATPGVAVRVRPGPQAPSAGPRSRHCHPDLPPMDERRARARAYLGRLDPAVSGQSGHNQSYYAACLVVRDFAVDPDLARELLDEFNARCQPPWSDAELAHKIADADHFDGPRGSKLIAAAHDQANDPYRLADLFLGQEPHPEGHTWRFWRDEWWHWDGGRYVRMADSELKAQLGIAIRLEMEDVQRRQAARVAADYQHALAEWQQAGAAKEKRPKAPKTPTVIPVTTTLVNNTAQALAARTCLPFAMDQPAWLVAEGGGGRRSYVGLTNGLLDVEAYLHGQGTYLQPHTPRWFSPVCLPYAWDATAQCPRWLRGLDLMFGGDHERIALLQEWFGYCLLPTTDLQRFLMLTGEGHNGKSVLCAALTALLGSANVSHVALESFDDRFSLSGTIGKLANIAAEVGELDKTAEGKLKMFTSGDLMTFDRKGIAAVTALPTARLVLATNNRPRFCDRTSGLWRRLLLVPCDVVIPPEQRVRGMDKVDWWERSGELPGMLRWAMEGLRRLRTHNDFTAAAACQTATREYRQESNPAAGYLLEHCATGPAYQTPCDALYRNYRNWCLDNGYSPLASNKFGSEVRRTFPGVERKYRGDRGQRVYSYEGLAQVKEHLPRDDYRQGYSRSNN